METQVVIFTLFLVMTTARAAVIDPGTCQFDGEESSQAVQAGIKKISPLIGHSYTSYEYNPTDAAPGVEAYKYTVGICANLGGTDATFAATQSSMSGGSSIDDRTIGTYADVHIMAGDDWVVLEYGAGEKYGSHCTGEDKRAVVMLQCDITVDDSTAQMIFVQEDRDQQRSCYFLFQMKHKALCPAYTVSSNGLSVGSILLIVFVCVVSVYLLVGFLYSRFVLGSKGLEQIPNYEFWKDFGNLQADGCDLVCRSGDRRRPGGFGGLGDDQLDQEEIRDDNLLPM